MNPSQNICVLSVKVVKFEVFSWEYEGDQYRLRYRCRKHFKSWKSQKNMCQNICVLSVEVARFELFSWEYEGDQCHLRYLCRKHFCCCSKGQVPELIVLPTWNTTFLQKHQFRCRGAKGPRLGLVNNNICIENIVFNNNRGWGEPFFSGMDFLREGFFPQILGGSLAGHTSGHFPIPAFPPYCVKTHHCMELGLPTIQYYMYMHQCRTLIYDTRDLNLPISTESPTCS